MIAVSSAKVAIVLKITDVGIYSTCFM
jgi:hypothetical protein